ncbi:MAG: hypothetical protein QOF76_2219 [Solirubrobacteraceae bacterium]|jgi:uncharacterized protein YjbI with pentapeptide repeats|nr:hypothetical protein [Solirubrobacteraceae bacterium]
MTVPSAGMQPDPPDLPPQPLPVDLDAARFDGQELVDATLTGKRFGLSLVDCVMRGCDIANVDARGAALRRVAIRSCRLTGTNLSESALTDVLITDSRLDLSALAAAELERVRFVGCSLAGADLQEARLRTVVFEDCDLREADLRDTRFELVELRGCRLDGVRGAEKFEGVRMPWADVLQNAGIFAAACGVKVLEAD